MCFQNIWPAGLGYVGTLIQFSCFIRFLCNRQKLSAGQSRQFGWSAKQAMTRVSWLTFDLFPWRQNRMRLVKTIQMGQTPRWVKWTHCYTHCERARRFTGRDLKYPRPVKMTCKKIMQPKLNPNSELWGIYTALSVCVALWESRLLLQQNGRFLPLFEALTTFPSMFFQNTNSLNWLPLSHYCYLVWQDCHESPFCFLQSIWNIQGIVTYDEQPFVHWYLHSR